MTSTNLDNGIIPEVIGSKLDFKEGMPSMTLHIKYGDHQVASGETLTPKLTSVTPEIRFDGKDQSYVLIMTDPDAPSRKDPKYRQWCHWITKIVVENKIMKMEDLLKYFGPAPPAGTGLHRYVFLLFTAKKDQKYSAYPTNMSQRRAFNAMNWAKNHKLELVGTEYFQALTD